MASRQNLLRMPWNYSLNKYDLALCSSEYAFRFNEGFKQKYICLQFNIRVGFGNQLIDNERFGSKTPFETEFGTSFRWHQIVNSTAL